MNPEAPSPARPPRSDRWPLIRAKLEPLKDRLLHAGTVCARRLPNGTRVWVLRYVRTIDGRRRHRSVYLGDEEMAAQTRALLQTWRAAAITPQQRQYEEFLQMVDLFARANDFSGRARRRLRAAARQALTDPFGKLRFTFGLEAIGRQVRAKKQCGRPSVAGLW